MIKRAFSVLLALCLLLGLCPAVLAAETASGQCGENLNWRIDGGVLSITGTNDQVLNREAYQDARANLPDGATELAVEGGSHAYFGNYGEQRGDGVATISRDEQQERTVEAIVALIKGE